MAIFVALLVPTLVISTVALLGLLIYGGGVIFFQPKQEEEDAAVAACTTPELLKGGGKQGSGKLLPMLGVAGRHSLQWQDIIFEVGGGRRGPPKPILRGCSGYAHPGELVALVGPSGAGKSTLLDILAMRLRPTRGQVLVGGELQGPSFRTVSSYVPQETSFVPTLSVWETLSMHASLRIPRGLTKEERNEIITSTLASMGLLKVKHSRVGGVLPGGLAVRGLSGGEARRLHIGCGVVAAPSTIFLDEPTSGLDSHAALILMEHLQHLAAGQRTILCSIHQPRQAIWEMFNKMELLAEGYLMYFGPVHEAIGWFRDTLGHPYTVDDCGLPADWLLDLVSIGFQSTLHSTGFQTLDQLKNASEIFKQQFTLPKGGSTDAAMSAAASGTGSAAAAQTGKCVRAYPTSFWNQVRVMMWRAVLSYTRNPADIASRIIMSLFVGIITGLVFIVISRDGLGPIQLMTAIFFTLLSSLLQPFAQMSLYIADRQFYIVDVMANLYSPAAYYLAQCLTAIPFTVGTGQILWLTIYGFCGFVPITRSILLSMVCQALVTLVSIQGVIVACYVMPNQDLAMLLATTNLTFTTLLAGFVVRVTDLTPVLQWISYVTPIRYAYQIMAILQFEDAKAGRSFLHYYGIRMSLGLNFGLLVIIYMAHHVVGYAALVILKKSKGIRK